MFGSAIRQCQVRPTAMTVAGRDGMMGATPVRQDLGISPNSVTMLVQSPDVGKRTTAPGQGS